MIRRILTVLTALGLALPAVLAASGPASAAPAPTAAVTAAIGDQGPCPYDDPQNDEDHPLIVEGSQGVLVRHARCLLREVWGYPVPDTASFTTRFKAHIMHFQTQKKLDVDGKIGFFTWRALHP